MLVTELFHDPTVVAELKRFDNSAVQAMIDALFHDPTVVAELKPDRILDGRDPLVHLFHDPTVVAELKLLGVRRVTRMSSAIPRPHGRGRIEANRGSDLTAKNFSYSTTPRSWPN